MPQGFADSRTPPQCQARHWAHTLRKEEISKAEPFQGSLVSSLRFAIITVIHGAQKLKMSP